MGVTRSLRSTPRSRMLVRCQAAPADERWSGVATCRLHSQRLGAVERCGLLALGLQQSGGRLQGMLERLRGNAQGGQSGSCLSCQTDLQLMVPKECP